MLEIVEYCADDGVSPFRRWFDDLDALAAAKVTVQITRLAVGNVGSLKGVGEGVLEARLDWGPGYRIYLGRDGARLVILLGGGTKRRQQADISAAKLRWQDYRMRRKGHS